MAALSKEEYLKRYLSAPTEDEPKKKRKKKPKAVAKLPRSVIVDDDVAWSDLKPKNPEMKQKEFEFDTAGEDAPVVYDEDGSTMISTELYKKREEDLRSKWAPLGSDNSASLGDGSPQRQKTHGLLDLSKAETDDNSPSRRRNHGSPSLSPSRKQNLSVNTKTSKMRSGGDVRRQWHDSDSSPPRRQRHDSPDESPVRRQRHDSDSSPLRRQRHDSPDESPVRRQRHDSDSSPLRRQRHDSPDQSPVRRKQHDSSDLSPPRGGIQNDSDQSPPRKRPGSDADLSPPRARRGSDSDQSPPRKGMAGLLSAGDLKRENEIKRKREAEMFASMDTGISGRGAKTVHRDKSGRKRDLEAEKRIKEEEEREKAKDDEKFKQWGKGVVQTEKARQRLEEDLHEMAKPLARYKDDKDLDAMLKEQTREDDPMLAYMQKKKASSDVKAGKKAKPVYKGPPPQPNRFGIPPGYRWDGVDRSNGFERRRFAMIANKQATDSVAHKWSVEDM
ncbi:BUD13 homolog [Nematostella vectensis]|uniref:BUD13 homolog n=1 Tax=Nematostella vectensis TaxID=45351 RepID=UPI00207758E2|nr:BUD13 homolog [Nematostella vectensis]